MRGAMIDALIGVCLGLSALGVFWQVFAGCGGYFMLSSRDAPGFELLTVLWMLFLLPVLFALFVPRMGFWLLLAYTLMTYAQAVRFGFYGAHQSFDQALTTALKISWPMVSAVLFFGLALVLNAKCGRMFGNQKSTWARRPGTTAEPRSRL